MLKNDIGYIRIDNFGNKTVPFLDKALKLLEKKNCQGIILDLRNNPGGLVKAAVALCSRFLDDKKLIIMEELNTNPHIEDLYRQIVFLPLI